jgi:drug/metabolite transporter (DMT)-like permease
MLAAVGFFALMDTMMKVLAEHYPALQVTFIRGAASIPFVLLPVALRGRWRTLRPVNLRLHLVRGVLGIVMLGGFIYALGQLSMSDTYSLFMCAPLLVTALSVPLLREKVSAAQWVAILLGMTGALLMLRPTGTGLVSLGGLAAMISALAYALNVLFVRTLSMTDSTESMVFSFTLILSVGAGLLALPGWIPLQWSDWPWIVGIGITGAIGQHLITEAFRYAPASVIVPFEYTAMVWAIAIDFVVWKVLPGSVTLVGSAIVITAGIYLVRLNAKQPAHVL